MPLSLRYMKVKIKQKSFSSLFELLSGHSKEHPAYVSLYSRIESPNYEWILRIGIDTSKTKYLPQAILSRMLRSRAMGKRNSTPHSTARCREHLCDGWAGATCTASDESSGCLLLLYTHETHSSPVTCESPQPLRYTS